MNEVMYRYMYVHYIYICMYTRTLSSSLATDSNGKQNETN